MSDRSAVPGIVEQILAIHGALGDARLPHAFGGALALAWCTQRARGTIDIDVNVFVDPVAHLRGVRPRSRPASPMTTRP